ncbi:MAG: ubiquitin-like small modifier protein 1 [Methanothrix sp.]|jgi:sulfur-carrier protein|nr:MoaD/ThiS family protein [Methanothrix sp.]
MIIIVKSFAAFRNILGKERTVELAEGADVDSLLKSLARSRPEAFLLLFGDAGLREDVNIFVKGKNIESLQGLSTRLAEGDEVALFPAAIGG